MYVFYRSIPHVTLKYPLQNECGLRVCKLTKRKHSHVCNVFVIIIITTTSSSSSRRWNVLMHKSCMKWTHHITATAYQLNNTIFIDVTSHWLCTILFTIVVAYLSGYMQLLHFHRILINKYVRQIYTLIVAVHRVAYSCNV